jgi:predicted transcriptional regulator
LLDTVETVEELSEFFRWYRADVELPDLLEVSDIEVTYSTDAEPYAPARRQTEILHSAERLHVLLPAIDLDSTKTITEQVTQRGLELETVVSPNVESTIESDEFAPLMSAKIQTGRSAVFVAREDLPFYVGLADDGRVQVGLADDEGLPRALLETSDDAVREWAEDVYEGYRKRARHKPIEEF